MILERINSIVWGHALIFILLGTGFIYTLKLRFIQFRMFPYLVSNFRDASNKNSGVSQFGTVCMSLGAAMGTGNITGVAAAVSIGGAGAVFWMWVSAFLGMALVYAENYLSVIYSTEAERGPMAYIGKGLGSRKLAVIFAALCICASFGMGGMVQVSSFTDSLRSCVPLNRYIAAIGIFLLIWLVVSGGAKRISSVAQVLLPFASLVYAASALYVIIVHRERIPIVFGDILMGAFGLKQAAGGAAGYGISRAVSAGIRRGVFSNEAGLGSSPILHSAAESGSPSLQGMCAMFEVFFDTIICCSLTAFAVLSVGEDISLSKTFGSIFGEYSDVFLAVEMAVFAFCTIIGWYYCGEAAYRYISGKRLCGAFSIVFAAAASLGAVFGLKTVWTLSDIFNGLMAFPNLAALIILAKKVKRE